MEQTYVSHRLRNSAKSSTGFISLAGSLRVHYIADNIAVKRNLYLSSLRSLSSALTLSRVREEQAQIMHKEFRYANKERSSCVRKNVRAEERRERRGALFEIGHKYVAR